MNSPERNHDLTTLGQKVYVFRDVKLGIYPSLRQALGSMPCYYVDSRINDSHFSYPHQTPSGSVRPQAEVGVIFVDFTKEVRWKEVIDLMTTEGLRPASFEVFVDALADKRSWGIGRRFVCLGAGLGESPMCPDAELIPMMSQFPLGHVSNNPDTQIPERFKRYFDLVRIGQIWASGTFFPAVLSE